jgi:LmbE family N-acetylglucosaminyl deacetylase
VKPVAGSPSVDRLLLTVAHPDDETFGCGSLLAYAADRGVATTVACATRGEAGTPTPESGVAVADLGRVREAELRDAADFLGVGAVQLFDWKDSGMEGAPEPGAFVAAPLDVVTATVASLIDAVRPTVVVTLDGSDGHRDHAHIRDATLLAVERTEWTVPRVYLQCLSRELMGRWADELRVRQPDAEYLAIAELGTPDELITTTIDTRAQLERREHAMRLHATQTSPYEVMPADLRRAFLATDRLRRVVPPWTDGVTETDLF